MTLLEPHRAKLAACGLTPETWMRAGLHSGSEAEVREILGYGGAGTALVIPYDEHYARVRIDHPGPDGKRYRSPKGSSNALYIPATLPSAVLTDSTALLYLTEGEFKALALVQHGFPAVGLAGVWSWKSRVHGKSLPIADLERVAWTRRRVVVVFDSDLGVKPPVAWAEHQLLQELRSRGAEPFVLRLPDGPGGQKLGVDDFLVAHGVEAFRALPMLSLPEADQERPTFLRIADLMDAYLLSAIQPTHRLHLGYPELDAIVRGVAPGELMQILGRSGVGKTAFMLNLIERMTEAGQIPTLIFSLEQPGLELFERMASLTTGLPGRELEQRARDEDPDLPQRLLKVCERWHHVVVVEQPTTLDRLDALVSAARASTLWPGPLRLVAVDYIGLIGHRRPATPYEQVSAAAKSLKQLAKTHRVGVVALAQIGREGESGGEPVTLHSGRDSGVLEEASDYVLGLWRPELREKLDPAARRAVKGQFKVRVLKNRGGRAPVTVTLAFERASLRIQPPLLPAPADDDEGDP